MKNLLFLIGYRGSGKTTVARIVAAQMGWDWLDNDQVLEERYGKTIRQIFAEEGEPGFRDKESAVLTSLCQRDRLVLATGGGVILRPENRAILRGGFAVWLTASAEVLYERIHGDATTTERRPNLAGGGIEEVREMLKVREPLYRECAHLVVDAEANSPAEIAARITNEPGVKRLRE